MPRVKSLEQRLYEALRNNRGMRLTADDVDQLLCDEAMQARIANVAAVENGDDEPGTEALNLRSLDTWAKYRKRHAGGES